MPAPEGPRELPATLLRDPELVRACRTRDFSAIFHLVRRRVGIYPSRIAALCGMTPSRVGEIMNGQRKLAHIDVIERVADGLRIPGALLGLAHRPWEIPRQAVVTEPEPASSVARTEQEEGAGQSRTKDVDDILSLVDEDRVTRSTLTAIQSSIEDYWRRDDQHGGAALRPAVVGQLRHVQRLIGSTAERDLKRGLQSMAAELARLAGWAYFDARRYSTARSYFSQALLLAKDIGDQQFIANVLSCMSLQATYEGDAREATALACAAQDTARDTTPSALVMSMLHMREAFALASLRDSSACHTAIDKAHQHFERATGEGPAPQWVRYFDETKLVVDTGIALAQLGEPHKAEPLIAEGFRRENATQQRGRAFHAFWLATTQLQQGALDKACDTASLALELATSIESPRVTGHVREFHNRLQPYARETSVIAFEARMREALA
ncbi:helix-turn-helix domain-containing protein [Streptomyces sp. NPDC059373]